MMRCQKPPFSQFFDSRKIPILVHREEELLHWSFYLLLVIEASQTLEMSHKSEQAVIPGK